ncbi:carboxypeptidase S, partial [Aureobasidium melanogenum]
MDEKQQLIGSLPVVNVISEQRAQAKKNSRWGTIKLVTACAALVAFLHWAFVLPQLPLKHHGKHGKHHHQKSQCPQVEPLVPSQQSDQLVNMDAYLKSPAFQNASIQRLSGAVQIDTQSFDDLGKVGEDKRWEVFFPFHEYLEKTFPLVYEHLKVEKVNTHGLVYTWQGSDASLKPTLLMAHQDTVPVPDVTLDAWTHPPWSGFFDGKNIWGRGSSDCKNQLIAILESVELLLDAGFTPARTVLLSFGFDEEISGGQGAGTLAPFILERYGPDSLAVIVDEGAGIDDVWGVTMATPGVAEKGYTDVVITIRMPGGHSSIPPDHTAIGVMSELITLIEADKYPLRLDGKNPYLGQMYCGAEHGKDFPKKLGKLLDKAQGQCKAKPDQLASEAAKAGPAIQYLMQTSIAVDVIGGGVKVNALPERVQAIVNHRINVGEHPADAHNKISGLAKGVAKKYGLSLHAFDNTTEAPSSISLTAFERVLEPAPVTPTSVDGETAYSILSGSIRALYGSEVIVAPGIMTGNTDTKYYWDLSRNIFRFAPGYDGESSGLGNIHTVDERVSIKNHVNTVKWFSLFIRNMDEAELK